MFCILLLVDSVLFWDTAKERDNFILSTCLKLSWAGLVRLNFLHNVQKAISYASKTCFRKALLFPSISLPVGRKLGSLFILKRYPRRYVGLGGGRKCFPKKRMTDELEFAFVDKAEKWGRMYHSEEVALQAQSFAQLSISVGLVQICPVGLAASYNQWQRYFYDPVLFKDWEHITKMRKKIQRPAKLKWNMTQKMLFKKAHWGLLAQVDGAKQRHS